MGNEQADRPQKAKDETAPLETLRLQQNREHEITTGVHWDYSVGANSAKNMAWGYVVLHLNKEFSKGDGSW